MKPTAFEIVLHAMLYLLGSTGVVLFSLIAYLEGMPL